MALHRIGLSAARTLRLVRANLVDLGIDWNRYGETDYRRTQEIGADLAEGGTTACSRLRLAGPART